MNALQRGLERLSKSKWFWIALTTLFFVFYAYRTWNFDRSDFTAYYSAGLRALSGETPYAFEETPFRYLPWTAFLFIPFSLFGLKAGGMLFFVTTFACFFLTYRRLHRLAGGMAVIVLITLLARFHNHDFQNAQINAFILILFFAWWDRRRESPVLAAFPFAVMASFKLIPFVFLLPLVLLRRWKESFAIGAWALVLNVAPLFLYDKGVAVGIDWLEHSRSVEFPAFVSASNVQGLSSALWWLLKDSISSQTFAWGNALFQVFLLCAPFLMTPRPQTPVETERREDWILASTMALAVLFAPMAWKHSYVQFMPLFALWLIEDPKLRQKHTRWLCGIVAIGMVALPSLLGIESRAWSDRMYLMPWTGLLVIFLGLFFAFRPQRDPV